MVRPSPAALLAFVLLCLTWGAASADSTPIMRLCPPTGINTISRGYEPGGIILTHFDRSAMWVYNVETGARYPLPETVPCGRNCRLSPDGRWLAYFNDNINAYSRMRIDGTGRALLTENAADVIWWTNDTLFIWTPGHGAYLLLPDGSRRSLAVEGVIAVQPNGFWAVRSSFAGGAFTREIVNLESGAVALSLGEDRSYYNALAWSPDGSALAYVAPVDALGRTGSEIFVYAPGQAAPRQVTELAANYGAVRINGVAVGELSWSPDSTRIAFWVTELLSADAESNLGLGVIHMLDIPSGRVTAFCGYGSNDHTPNPSRLVWSPDGQYLAFGGLITDEPENGYQLLALDTQTGVFSSLSTSVAAPFGSPDVIAWGLPPG